ncbi:TPA: membrane protein insertase YidC [Candidatus Poribacteria bacterium]|nr:membrane protein insertase YidC [Candidatus Poribacteria bacterium]
MEKNHILFFVISAFIMIVYYFFIAPIILPNQQEKRKQAERKTVVDKSSSTPKMTNEEFKSPDDIVTEGEKVSSTHTEKSLGLAASKSATIGVETEKYKIRLATTLAVPLEWSLKDYPDRSKDQQEPLNLIPRTTVTCLSIQPLDNNMKLDWIESNWAVKGDFSDIKLTPRNSKQSLTFYRDVGDALRVFKKFTFYYDRYFVDLDLSFENLSDNVLTTPLDESGYELKWGPGISADLLPHEVKSGAISRYGKKGVFAYTGEGNLKEKLEESEESASIKWVGITNKYFAVLMLPDPKLEAEYKREVSGEETSKGVVAPNASAVLKIKPKGKQTNLFRIYVGPKIEKILKQVEYRSTGFDKPYPSPLLHKIVDFGWLFFLVWPMLWVLNGCYKIFGNYGIAIILLTVIMKIILFPLTRKSYQSMKDMQRLQPEIAELREKYRDDPQKLNQATMLLYKRHKVNPFGGCLPMLPQMPMFFAIFSLLGSAVELRGQPFFLWIDDLTAPDEFLLLPFTLPFLGNSLRILPIINAVATWFSSKMTGTAPAADNTQAKMMQYLPFIFVFMFYNWASGFVLYWLAQSVFTIGQNLVTKKMVKDEIQENEPEVPKQKRSKLNK